MLYCKRNPRMSVGLESTYLLLQSGGKAAPACTNMSRRKSVYDSQPWLVASVYVYDSATLVVSGSTTAKTNW